MKFQTKLRAVYAVLGVLTAVVAGTIYYSVSMERMKEQEKQTLSINAEQLGQQYGQMIQSMKDVSYYLLSDPDTLTAITTISTMERSDRTEQYFLDAEEVIRSSENNDYISQRFYRVVFCNNNCDPIANHNLDSREIRNGVDYREMPWYGKIQESQDTFTILGIHKDTWGKEENPQVLSVVKEIQGKNMGYIEVQQSLDIIQDTLLVADPDLNVCILDGKGNVIYQNREQDLAFCRKLLDGRDVAADTFTDSGGREVLAAGEYVEDVGTTVLVYKDSADIGKDSAYILYMTIFVIGSMLVFAFLYVMVSTRHLTRPLVQLQNAMKNTSLENLNQSMGLDLKDGDDEFQRMGQAYEDMRTRLYHAIQREQQLSTLQLQTQFDMLQAQVNPHFIYNVLNVISGRGSMNDDEVICDICDDLAGMLRYSTDTKEKYATLREEITYLELYFSLLKYRYRHKLEYSISLDPAVENQRLPKLVVQQIVENSVSHGFRNTSGVMRISVTGGIKQGFWYIRVKDNGEGFSSEALKSLEEGMEQIRKDLSADCRNVEMRIGGMGILNTFARLYLLNGDNMIFRITNPEDGGAEVTIGAALQ